MSVFVYFALCIAIGIAGSGRKIGFGWSLFWSLLLSPIIGLIIMLLSNKK